MPTRANKKMRVNLKKTQKINNMSRAKQEPFSHLPPSQYSVWQREYRTSERQHIYTLHTRCGVRTQCGVTASRTDALKLIRSLAVELENTTMDLWQKHMWVKQSIQSPNRFWLRESSCSAHQTTVNFPTLWLDIHYESHNWQLRKTTTWVPSHASSQIY